MVWRSSLTGGSTPPSPTEQVEPPLADPGPGQGGRTEGRRGGGGRVGVEEREGEWKEGERDVGEREEGERGVGGGRSRGGSEARERRSCSSLKSIGSRGGSSFHLGPALPHVTPPPLSPPSLPPPSLFPNLFILLWFSKKSH